MNKEIEAELYSFIVDSNLEHSFLNQLNDKANWEVCANWLGIGKATDNPDEGNKPQEITAITRANDAAERLEKANTESSKVAERMEKAAAALMLGGKSAAGVPQQDKPKELTDEEYADAIREGRITYDE